MDKEWVSVGFVPAIIEKDRWRNDLMFVSDRYTANRLMFLCGKVDGITRNLVMSAAKWQ